ncbi:VanW family protein [Virgisporangium ochraceum]|uniref:Vanomycin resistance protein VanB n=1 Tax=Virgisporangium ochraceum TaxID=65505 RepID=A0A8J3ZUD6_9ACTN|nr:VanW family protein [Virgisporangium ochraceum]GIJ68243.1 vanomycin resistance protein VanB [Virgisporangium ochraceum]
MVSQIDHIATAPHDPAPGPRPIRWRRGRVVTLAVAVGVVAAGVPTGIAYAGDIAHGVHVLGVDVGGRSTAEAARLLERRLAGRVTAPVQVRVGGSEVTFTAADAGLTLDARASARRAADTRPAPWTAVFGSRDVDPVVSLDLEKLTRILQPHVGTQGTAPVWPAIRFPGAAPGERPTGSALTPVTVAPRAGRGLNRHAAAERVREGWLRTARIDLPITDVTPVTTAADLDTLKTDLAEPAVAHPVTLTVDGRDVEITPAAIAASLTIESDADGRVVPRVDPAKLRTALAPVLATVQTAPTDATFTLHNGQPVAVPDAPGRAVDFDAAAKALLDVLGRPAPRRITAGTVPVPAARTAQTLRDLGIVELVSTFTTKMLPGQARNRNIKLVADLARGTVVPAGATFSLNKLTGDRTLAKGYLMAPVIENGKIKNAPGGGISQFATTAFNAGYYAGMVDVEHRPHSYHFDRYPAVIEATTIYPELDMAWRNDSPHAVLVDTQWTETSLTVSLFGTKRFDIETVYGPKTNVTSPPAITLAEADCNATDGIPGFRQEAWRVFEQNGVELKRERFAWTYRAEPKFTCAPR